jgi:hypothetical protein
MFPEAAFDPLLTPAHHGHIRAFYFEIEAAHENAQRHRQLSSSYG